jgi:hypothetical protein
MFKVGDVVRVRKDLEVGKKYGSLLLHGFMRYFIGKEVKIIDSNKHKQYKCYNEKFKEFYFFTSEMLEPVSKAKEYSLIVTDKKVIILDKENKKKGLAECHEDDVFQFEVGVKLAWDRLHGIKEETLKPIEYKLYDCNGVELKEGIEQL